MNVIVPPAVVGEVADTVPEAVCEVSHLSVLVDPPSGFVMLHEVPLSNQ